MSRGLTGVCSWCWSTIPPGVEITWRDKRFDTTSCRVRYIEESLIKEAEEAEKNGQHVHLVWPSDG